MALQYASSGALTDFLTTQLNALAADATSATGSVELDNATSKKPLVTLQLYVGSAAFGSGDTISVYMLPSIDGTNYADGDGTDNLGAYYVGAFQLDNVTAAQYQALERISIGPYKYKCFVVSNCTPTLAATLNTIKYQLETFTDA